MPSSMVAGRSPSNRSGGGTVCPPARSSSANARTPSVSPCTWWNSTTSAIGALLAPNDPGLLQNPSTVRVGRERAGAVGADCGAGRRGLLPEAGDDPAQQMVIRRCGERVVVDAHQLGSG